MCDNLCRVFKDVAKSEIAQEEEGNVLYFVKRNKQDPEELASFFELSWVKALDNDPV